MIERNIEKKDKKMFEFACNCKLGRQVLRDKSKYPPLFIFTMVNSC